MLNNMLKFLLDLSKYKSFRNNLRWAVIVKADLTESQQSNLYKPS